MPDLGDAETARIAALVPELPVSLYEKWVGMFADRLLETVPVEQVEELCRNTEESNAALLLLYSMFMESGRMEKVVTEDITAFNRAVEAGEAALTGTGFGAKTSNTSH